MPFITSKWAGSAPAIELSIIMICYINIISYSYAVKRHLLSVFEGLTCGYWAEMSVFFSWIVKASVQIVS